MPEDRPKARFGASTVVMGAEDVLGRRLMHLDLAIEPFCSSLEPSGHRGKHCRGAVDALGLSIIWYCYTCGPKALAKLSIQNKMCPPAGNMQPIKTKKAHPLRPRYVTHAASTHSHPQLTNGVP